MPELAAACVVPQRAAAAAGADGRRRPAGSQAPADPEAWPGVFAGPPEPEPSGGAGRSCFH